MRLAGRREAMVLLDIYAGADRADRLVAIGAKEPK
jgi:hypothetical protein